VAEEKKKLLLDSRQQLQTNHTSSISNRTWGRPMYTFTLGCCFPHFSRTSSQICLSI